MSSDAYAVLGVLAPLRLRVENPATPMPPRLRHAAGISVANLAKRLGEVEVRITLNNIRPRSWRPWPQEAEVVSLSRGQGYSERVIFSRYRVHLGGPRACALRQMRLCQLFLSSAEAREPPIQDRWR